MPASHVFNYDWLFAYEIRLDRAVCALQNLQYFILVSPLRDGVTRCGPPHPRPAPPPPPPPPHALSPAQHRQCYPD